MKEYTPGEEAKITNNYNAYNKGFEAGKLHSQPSPTTLQFMENITDQITELKQDLKETLKDIPRKADMELYVVRAIDGALKACDNRYAPKRVEIIINWLAVVVAGALITGAITLIYKFIETTIKQ